MQLIAVSGVVGVGVYFMDRYDSSKRAKIFEEPLGHDGSFLKSTKMFLNKRAVFTETTISPLYPDTGGC